MTEEKLGIPTLEEEQLDMTMGPHPELPEPPAEDILVDQIMELPVQHDYAQDEVEANI